MNIDNDELEKIDELVDKYRQDIMLAAQGINSDNKTYSDSSVNVAALASVNLKNDLRRLLTAQRQSLKDEVLSSIPGDNYAPTGSQHTVEAVNRERQRLRTAISTIFEGKGDTRPTR